MPRFTSVEFADDQKSASVDIITAAENMTCWLEIHIAPCRELSLALTKLEECVMWANKAIANGSLKGRL